MPLFYDQMNYGTVHFIYSENNNNFLFNFFQQTKILENILIQFDHLEYITTIKNINLDKTILFDTEKKFNLYNSILPIKIFNKNFEHISIYLIIKTSLDLVLNLLISI